MLELRCGRDEPKLIAMTERGEARRSKSSVGPVKVFQMGSVRTPIIGRNRPTPRHGTVRETVDLGLA